MVWNPWKIFVEELIFSKILGLLPVTLLKKLLHWYFSRSLIINFRIPIFTKCLSVATSKIHRFLTSFLKLVFLCWNIVSYLHGWNRYLLFYQNVFSTGIKAKIHYMINHIWLIICDKSYNVFKKIRQFLSIMINHIWFLKTRTMLYFSD